MGDLLKLRCAIDYAWVFTERVDLCLLASMKVALLPLTKRLGEAKRVACVQVLHGDSHLRWYRTCLSGPEKEAPKHTFTSRRCYPATCILHPCGLMGVAHSLPLRVPYRPFEDFPHLTYPLRDRWMLGK
jgi:hypothetical protein